MKIFKIFEYHRKCHIYKNKNTYINIIIKINSKLHIKGKLYCLGTLVMELMLNKKCSYISYMVQEKNIV